MEKQEKTKLMERLLAFYPTGKGVMMTGLVLSGLSAIVLLLPIIFIWLGVKEIVMMYPNITITSTLQNYAYYAVGSALLGLLIYCIALLCTHKVAFHIAKNMKYQAL